MTPLMPAEGGLRKPYLFVPYSIPKWYGKRLLVCAQLIPTGRS